MKKFSFSLIVSVICLGSFCLTAIISPAAAQTDPLNTDAQALLPQEAIWPRTLDVDGAHILIYQPQLEHWEGDHIDARFASSVTLADEDEPYFGTVWVSARMKTDRKNRIATLVEAKAIRVRFPGASEANEAAYEKLLKEMIPQWNQTISLDQLIASMDAIEEQRKVRDDGLNTAPPKIIVTTTPSVLIQLDGEPILEPIDNSQLMAVINTPYPMLLHREQKAWYLMGDTAWYKAYDIGGAWKTADSVPKEVAQLRPTDEESQAGIPVDAQGTSPSIIVATQPTELISIDGKPRFTPVSGVYLLYVENTDSQLLFEVDTGLYYALLSGRWYKTPFLDGDWEHVPPNQLPDSFLNISPDSPKGELLASVSGTTEAREAMLDAQIPQTQAISRADAELKVQYDGAPDFADIPETSLTYAQNTATPVVHSGAAYYAVDQGVWFVGPSPQGPWTVADAIPPEIQQIPASSPVHHIKYVHIYHSTPEVVYVGYTPGYLGHYIYRGTVVYGTGYYYHPWYRTHYYPRPATWGYGVRYSSYYGWSFGLVLSDGPFSFYFGYGWGRPYYRGWWGPYRYRPPYYRPPYYRPPWHRPPKPVHLPERPSGKPDRPNRPNRPSSQPPVQLPAQRPETPTQLPGSQTPVQRPVQTPEQKPAPPSVQQPVQLPSQQPGQTPVQRPAPQQPVQRPSIQQPIQRPNVQQPVQQPVQRPVQRPSIQQPVQQPSTQRPASQPKGQRPAVQQPTPRPNNIYTDRKGNVFKRENDTWQQRTNRAWTPSNQNRPTQGQGNTKRLNRQVRSRERGVNRTLQNQRIRQQGGQGRSQPRSRPRNQNARPGRNKQ